MTMWLKQSTAVTIMFGPFVDKTDGVTLKTDSTTITDIDHASTGIFLSKNGATAAIRHATVTASVADAYGMMKVTLDTTDTGTLGRLDVLFAKAATYLPVNMGFQIVPAAMFDSLVTGSGGAIPGAVAGAAGGLFIAGTNAATTITTALTTTFTGNLTGSVASLTANNDKTGYALSAAGSAALTEGYAADGAAATLPQLLYMLLAVLTEANISSTTLTAKKLDGLTTAATFTLDSATAPTSITRAS